MVKLRRFLKPYRDAGALHCLFAPHRFLDEQVFLTRSHQFGVVVSVTGTDPECLTESTLESHARRMGAALRSFDERFRLYQYVIKQDHAAVATQEEHANPTVRETVRRRNEFLYEEQGLYSLRLFIVILFEPPLLERGSLARKSSVRTATKDLKHSRDVLIGTVESFTRSVADLLGAQILSKAEAFQFFRLLGNLDPEVASAERLKHDRHVDYYIPSLPLACTDAGIRLGGAQLEVLSLKEPPSSTFPHLLRDLLALSANFIVCSEFRRVGNDEAVTTIRAAQNHFHWSQWVADLPSILSMVLNRGNRENVIADKSAQNDVEDLDHTLARINNGGEYLGEFSLTVVLFDWDDAAQLKAAAADVVKIFGNHEASLFQESYNALNAYLSILPGNQAFNLRRTWLLSGNYADLAFCYAPRCGEKRNPHLKGEQLVVLETNDATPYYFNLHEDDRLGVLLFGASGVGKSVLANLLIDHSQKYAPYTFILDLGGSYRQITRKHGGSYLEMQFGERQSFRINPFVLPATANNLQFLFTFVRLLLTNSGYSPTVEDDRELFDAIEAMYILSPEQRTLGNLLPGLPPQLGMLLRPWVAGGQYGSVFDNAEDTLTFSHFQTFDFQGMDELYPQVLGPLLFYVFQRVSQMVYDPALLARPKQLWADEVWRFLSNGTARQYLIAAGKTWRKHNGGIALITQSAADLRNAEVLDLVNEICLTKILLANPGADLGSYAEMFRLNEREVELFSGLIPKRQMLLKTPTRSKVLNVHLDPHAYWQYTNLPYDNEQRKQVTEDFSAEEGFKVLASQSR